MALIYQTEPAKLVSRVAEAAKDMGWTVRSKMLKCYVGTPGEHVIILIDFEGPLQSTLQEAEPSGLQNLTTNASSILCVTQGGFLKGKVPEYGIVAGLARSVTAEKYLFGLDDSGLLTQTITRIPTSSASSPNQLIGKPPSVRFWRQYCVDDRLTYISRLLPNEGLNDIWSEMSSPGKVVFEPDRRTEEPVEPNDVEVKLVLAGLTKEETLVITRSDYPTTFSHDISGTVSQVGQDVHNLKVGDPVVGFSSDKFATYERTQADPVQNLERGDAVEELAALSIAYAAAIHSLMNLAKTEAEENTLIMNATGVSGLAAIKICNVMKANAFVCVDPNEEADQLITEYDLGDRQILRHSDQSVHSRCILLQATTASVLFSAVPSPHRPWLANAGTFRTVSRFVDFGRKNVLKRSVLDPLALHTGTSYLSFDIPDLYGWKPETLASLNTADSTGLPTVSIATYLSDWCNRR
ncbi:MAG: hypothetical protein Q9168_006005 [Polycauliona sp. 1 TL-2023]